MMNELESKIRAPSTSPESLLAAILNLTSPSADMRVSESMAASRLRAIAEHHGGEVPLHGRLFAEFLHYAFPTECPYPHILEDAEALSPSSWASGRAQATQHERRQHLQAPEGDADANATAQIVTWSDDEVLPLLEPARLGRDGNDATLVVAMLAAVFAVLRSGLAGWRSAMALSGAEKEKGLLLPLRI